jgi:hypothetical protein
MDTACVPNPCEPTGACCFLDETCQILTLPQCVADGGLYYLGPGTVCDGNPCPNSAVGEPLTTPVFALQGASPNPCTGPTTIHYQLAREGAVRLEIFDPAGRSIRVIASGRIGRGIHAAEWDGKTDAGLPVPAGVYYVGLSTGQGRLAAPVIVLK